MDNKQSFTWNWLERNRATLFIIAGIVLAGNALLLGLETFSGFNAPELPLLPLGFLLGILGLLGLYPRLVMTAPGVVKTAAVLAIVPTIAWTFFTISGILELMGAWMPPENTPIAIVILVTTSVIATYILFSIASFRGEQTSGFLASLLLLPAALFVLLLIGSSMGVAEWIGPFIVDSGHMIAHLAIGFTLLSESQPMMRNQQLTESAM
jgi:hypothetical protein